MSPLFARLHLFASIAILTLSGCCGWRNISAHKAMRATPVFIHMPRNIHIFDNCGPLAYQALFDQYSRLGYQLHSNASQAYTLLLFIKNADQINKLVSPDIVQLHYTLRLELECALIDFAGKQVTKKTFTVSQLISAPKNPILKSDFVRYAYNRLFKRAAVTIENTMRPYLIQAFGQS
jgi:hypothetical protein